MSMSLPFKKICDDFGLTPFGVRHALEQYQIIITELTDGFFSKLTYDAPVILDRVKECFAKEYSDMESVRHGQWLVTDAYPHNVYCSKCYKTFAQAHWAIWEDGSLPREYCPNCGAKMDERNESSDPSAPAGAGTAGATSGAPTVGRGQGDSDAG